MLFSSGQGLAIGIVVGCKQHSNSVNLSSSMLFGEVFNLKQITMPVQVPMFSCTISLDDKKMSKKGG
jgi:hypothetical protein